MFRQAFDIIDKNGDGIITTDDLSALLKSAGQKPTKSQLNEMIHSVDADGNGNIDFPEFLAMMSKQVQELDDDIIQNAFAIFDRDGDGYITPNELSEFLKSMAMDSSPETVRGLINEVSKSRNGKINFMEFKAIFKF